MQVFLQETFPAGTTGLILKHAKGTKKPCRVPSKKIGKEIVVARWLEKIMAATQGKSSKKGIAEETVLPNTPNQLRADLFKM